MVKETKIDILGVEYKVYIGNRKVLEHVSPEYDGACYTFDKEIFVVEDDRELLTEKGEVEVLHEILTHEVAHAFLFESGFTCSDNEESLVVWLSRYVRKINNTVIEILDNLGLI